MIVGLVLFGLFAVFRVESPFTEFDPDEGLNLGKAFMVGKGYPLYTEVWSDQPPLFTYLLQAWMSVFGWTLDSARLLSTAFSCLLLLTLYWLASSTHGRLAGAASCGLLMVSSQFYRAAGAVMIGLPALSLSLLSLAVLRSGTQGSRYSILSGTLFALALLTKLFVILYIPAFVYLMLGERKVSRRESLLWLSSCLFTLLASAVLSDGLQSRFFEQLLLPHSTGQSALTSSSGLNFLRFDLSIVLICILTAVCYRRQIKLPVFLLVPGLLAVHLHRPVWWHHYFLASIPMCWIAGIGISNALRDLRTLRGTRSILKTSGIGLIGCLTLYFLLYLPVRLRKVAEQCRPRFHLAEPLRKELQKAGARTKWLATDRPLCALFLGCPLPPNQVVMSTKRRAVGAYSNQDFFDEVDEFRPEQILLGRFPELKRQARSKLAGRYELVLSHGGADLYRRIDLLEQRP